MGPAGGKERSEQREWHGMPHVVCLAKTARDSLNVANSGNDLAVVGRAVRGASALTGRFSWPPVLTRRTSWCVHAHHGPPRAIHPDAHPSTTESRPEWHSQCPLRHCRAANERLIANRLPTLSSGVRPFRHSRTPPLPVEVMRPGSGAGLIACHRAPGHRQSDHREKRDRRRGGRRGRGVTRPARQLRPRMAHAHRTRAGHDLISPDREAR